MEQNKIIFRQGGTIANIHDKTMTIEINSKDDVVVEDSVEVKAILCKGNSKVITRSFSNIYCYEQSQVKVLQSQIIVELHDWAKAKVFGKCLVFAYDNSNATMLIGSVTLYNYAIGVLLNKSKAKTMDNSMVYANDNTRVDAYGNSVVNKYDKSRIYAHSENVGIYLCK